MTLAPGPSRAQSSPRERWDESGRAEPLPGSRDKTRQRGYTHLGHTHLLVEPFVLATYRRLPERHPVSNPTSQLQERIDLILYPGAARVESVDVLGEEPPARIQGLWPGDNAGLEATPRMWK